MSKQSEIGVLLSALEKFGADTSSHSSRTLIEHLKGTADTLQRWKNERDVCLAGLFHSIYGTVYYGTVTVRPDDRPTIRHLIGTRAEYLAYVFCAVNRQELFEQSDCPPPYRVLDRFTKQTIEICAADFADLFEIEIANFVEQVPTKDDLDAKKLPWYIEYFGRCRRHVSTAAYRRYREFFGLGGAAECRSLPSSSPYS